MFLWCKRGVAFKWSIVSMWGVYVKGGIQKKRGVFVKWGVVFMWGGSVTRVVSKRREVKKRSTRVTQINFNNYKMYIMTYL